MAPANDDDSTDKQTTVLYRAVVFAEWQSIEATEVFANLAGNEVKYFSTTLDGALSYAAQAQSGFREGPFWIVRTSIRTDLIAEDMRCSVDRGGIPTVTIPNELFTELEPPETVRLPSDRKA
jgi:hypothetical protein